jgi:glutamate-1-semialdehyde 2,1-aminomutase
LPVRVNRVGSMLTVFFAGSPVTDYQSALACDTQRFGVYFRSMLEQGIYMPPSQFEAAFVSAAHTQGEIDQTIEAHRSALDKAFA